MTPVRSAPTRQWTKVLPSWLARSKASKVTTCSWEGSPLVLQGRPTNLMPRDSTWVFSAAMSSWPSELNRTTVSMPIFFNWAYAAGLGCAPRNRCASTWPKLSIPVMNGLPSRWAFFPFRVKGRPARTRSKPERKIRAQSSAVSGRARARLRLVEFIADLNACDGGLSARLELDGARSIPNPGAEDAGIRRLGVRMGQAGRAITSAGR